MRNTHKRVSAAPQFRSERLMVTRDQNDIAQMRTFVEDNGQGVGVDVGPSAKNESPENYGKEIIYEVVESNAEASI